MGKKNYQPHFLIDLLLVDVEGYDWQALGQGGADWTLRHARYLEFEYHGIGAWGKTDSLVTAVSVLDERFGFTCYWAGKGQLDGITGCWQAYMEMRSWSNVVCVNRSL